jgi:hypothetical protein
VDDATSEAAAYVADGQRIVSRALAGEADTFAAAALGRGGLGRGGTGISSGSSSTADILNLASYVPSSELAGAGLGGGLPGALLLLSSRALPKPIYYPSKFSPALSVLQRGRTHLQAPDQHGKTDKLGC